GRAWRGRRRRRLLVRLRRAAARCTGLTVPPLASLSDRCCRDLVGALALPDGSPGVQIAFPAAVHWRVADHQRRRLRGPELHGVILSGLSEQAVYPFSAYS